MAWIESHQELLGHPKTLRLAAELKCSVPTAIGYLHILWWWALDYAPDGRVGAGDRNIVAQACQWRGKAERFWQALMVAGFIEETDEQVLRIHDWMDYAGRLLEKRAAHVARTLRKRGAQQDRNERASGVSTVPYLTVPDRTGPPPLVPPKSETETETENEKEFTCCVLADVTQGREHQERCPSVVRC